jgi:hypothetical protein
MPDIPIAQLLILIAFILFPLINLLLRRMQRRIEQQAPRQPPPPQPAPRTFAPPPPEIIAALKEPARAPELRETPAPPRSGGRFRKKALFRNRRELRRAVILMTVLGPCRAADSPTAEGRQFSQ